MVTRFILVLILLIVIVWFGATYLGGLIMLYNYYNNGYHL